MIGGALPRWLVVQYVRDDVVGAAEIDGDVEGALVFDRESGMELDSMRRGYSDSFITKSGLDADRGLCDEGLYAWIRGRRHLLA